MAVVAAVAGVAAALGERVGVRTALAEVDDGGGERVVHRDVRRVLEERHAAQLRVVAQSGAERRARASAPGSAPCPPPSARTCNMYSYYRILLLLNSRMRLLYECALSVTHQLSTISHIHL